MRLIDADAFKGTVAEFLQKQKERLNNPLWESIGVNNLNKLIDNAPTVEVSGLPKIHYDRGFIAGYEKAIAERPQGKWVYTDKEDKEKGYGGYCSNCKCDTPIFNEDWKMRYCETAFCPNCGADMRKPNCVTCNHFGNCEGCEKEEEE